VSDPGGDRRLGGWLLVFVLTRIGHAAWAAYYLYDSGRSLAAASPAGTVPDSRTAIAAQVAAFTILFAGTVYGLWLVASRSARTRRYWVRLLLASVPALVLIRYSGNRRDDVLRAAGIVPESDTRPGPPLSTAVLQALVWAAYWRRSARARRTFPADGSPPNVALQPAGTPVEGSVAVGNVTGLPPRAPTARS
jgi:hypothetical protein